MDAAIKAAERLKDLLTDARDADGRFERLALFSAGRCLIDDLEQLFEGVPGTAGEKVVSLRGHFTELAFVDRSSDHWDHHETFAYRHLQTLRDMAVREQKRRRAVETEIEAEAARAGMFDGD